MRKGKRTLCINTGTFYESGREAARANNLSYASVIAMCEDRQDSHHGMYFCYVEDAAYKIAKIAKITQERNKMALRKELAEAQARMNDAQARKQRADEDLAKATAAYEAIQAKLSQ